MGAIEGPGVLTIGAPDAGSAVRVPLAPGNGLPEDATREGYQGPLRPVAASVVSAADLGVPPKATPARIGLGAAAEAPRTRTVFAASGATPTEDGYPPTVAAAGPTVIISVAARRGVVAGPVPHGRSPATAASRPPHAATPPAARPSGPGTGITRVGSVHPSTSK